MSSPVYPAAPVAVSIPAVSRVSASRSSSAPTPTTSPATVVVSTVTPYGAGAPYAAGAGSGWSAAAAAAATAASAAAAVGGGVTAGSSGVGGVGGVGAGSMAGERGLGRASACASASASVSATASSAPRSTSHIKRKRRSATKPNLKRGKRPNKPGVCHVMDCVSKAMCLKSAKSHVECQQHQRYFGRLIGTRGAAPTPTKPSTSSRKARRKDTTPDVWCSLHEWYCSDIKGRVAAEAQFRGDRFFVGWNTATGTPHPCPCSRRSVIEAHKARAKGGVCMFEHFRSLRSAPQTTAPVAPAAYAGTGAGGAGAGAGAVQAAPSVGGANNVHVAATAVGAGAGAGARDDPIMHVPVYITRDGRVQPANPFVQLDTVTSAIASKCQLMLRCGDNVVFTCNVTEHGVQLPSTLLMLSTGTRVKIGMLFYGDVAAMHQGAVVGSRLAFVASRFLGVSGDV